MKQLIFIFAIFVFASGCSQLPPQVKERDVNVAIFGAEEESVKIFCNGSLILNQRIPVANRYGISLSFYVPRTKEKMRLVILRRGVESTFVVDPQHFGDVDIYFDTFGGVSIGDGSKMPPMG